jgi:hypothetical protein
MDPRDEKTALPTDKAPEMGGPEVPSLGNDQSSTRQGSLRAKSDRDVGSLENGSMDNLIEDKSRGVQEMECLVENINMKLLVTIYGALILLSYVLSLSTYPGIVYDMY